MTTTIKRRLIFMGTPDFSVPTLKVLIDSLHDIVAVYSQPPRSSGRGHKITNSPIHIIAEKYSIPVFTPTSLQSLEEKEKFSSLKADLAVVAAYGLILPVEILKAPRYGCFNIHASLLPKWRGAAPIQRAILAGDIQTGITLMQMDVGLDTGDMLAKELVKITLQTTGQSLHDALSLKGASMMLPLLAQLEELNPKPQDDATATYAKKLSKKEASLDFSKTATELDRQIRAFTPWPGSFFTWQGKKIKILTAVVVNNAKKHGDISGVILANKESLFITCSKGVLDIKELQVQGKNPMGVKAFLNGYSPTNGDIIDYAPL